MNRVSPCTLRGVCALCASMALFCAPVGAFAYSEETITASKGKPMFEFRYYDAGESWIFDKRDSQTSTFTLNEAIRGELRRAGEFWADILGPRATNTAPIPFVVGTYNNNGADAISRDGEFGGFTASQVVLQITQGHAFPVDTEASSQIRLGTMDWYIAPHPTNLPQNGEQADTFSVVTHELMHALGMGTTTEVATQGNNFQFMFPDNKSKNFEYLVDKYGTQAKPQMLVSFEPVPGEVTFILDKPVQDRYGLGQAYFRGPQVLEVIGTAKLGNYGVNGLPIRGFELSEGAGWGFDANGLLTWVKNNGYSPELSHIELDNSLMSHYNWRNYVYYMEAELALLQDLGHNFDRKNNFGDSVYESDLTNWESRHGYSARTADGTGWIANAHNTTPYGVGLHVYGGNNTLTQRHDILSSGVAGTGIRIDGTSNTLSIAQGTRVHALGDYSTGLLLAYGKNHHIIHRGDIAATGQGGIGIQLDFGDNMLGNKKEMRGSYMFFTPNPGYFPDITANITGPLARALDITGSVAGRAAAIYVSSNAYVEHINIMRGASLSGDIISLWDPANPDINLNAANADLTTQLTFGRAPDATGVATASADTGFAMQYTGNILGAESLHMQLVGGRLSFNGNAEVLSVLNQGRLTGNANYTLSGANPTFTNAGVLAPGNSIGHMTINGAFVQTSAGSVEMEFSPSGSDRLSVSGNVSLDGTLHLRPLAAYYASGDTLRLDSLFAFSGGAPAGAFAQVEAEQPLSPTLRAAITFSPDTLTAQAQVSRLPNAYTRFAGSANGVRQARALQGLAEVATGDMQELLATLDFSAVDGSDIRRALPQLSPAAYAMAAQASAEANLSMGRMALAHLRSAAQSAAAEGGLSAGEAATTSAEQWSTWVMPFGGGSAQQGHGDLAGYNSSQVGVMGGVYRQGEGITAGLYAAFARRQMDMWTAAGAQARSEALHLGAEALWRPQGDEGWYAWGQVQAGMENTDMRRNVAFSGYARESKAEWLSFSGTASAGGGWQWRMGEFVFGPRVGLEYALNLQPTIEEWGGQGARLNMDAYTRHDLRGVAGLSLAWDKNLSEQRRIRATVDAQWRQELLPSERDMRSHFVGYGDHSFTTNIDREGQGSLGLSGGVQVDLRQDVTLSAHVDADVLRTGYSSVGGGLSLRWEF